MRMTLTTNGIFAIHTLDRAVIVGRITAADRTAGLIAQGRHPVIAHVLAHGGLTAALMLSAGDARLCGADIGLFTKERR
jgi:hypothetical protein